MAKHTPRDYVHVYARIVGRETDDDSGWYRSNTFGATDVLDRLEVDFDDLDDLDRLPSDRMVRDVLATLVDLGEIERARTQGQYEPFPGDLPEHEEPEPAQDDAQADAGRAGEHGGASAGSSPSASVTTRTPSVGGRESSEPASTTTADPTEGFDPDADTDALLDDARAESDDQRRRSVLDAADEAGVEREELRKAAVEAAVDLSKERQALDALVGDLDVPGREEVAAERRDAVRAVLDYLREGPATQSILREEVYPDHSGDYGSSRGWWEHLVLPALRELAEQHDDLQAPDGRGPWRLE